MVVLTKVMAYHAFQNSGLFSFIWYQADVALKFSIVMSYWSKCHSGFSSV
jgi:hypothetical protein